MKRKILFWGGLRAGGAEHQMVIIATLLKRDGYDVTFLFGGQSTFYRNQLEAANIRVIQVEDSAFFSFMKMNMVRLIFILRRILKRERFETVVSFLGEWNFYNCLLAEWKSTSHKAITGIRNNRDAVFLSNKERFFSLFERYSYRIVSNSNSAKNKYAHYYPGLTSKLMTIYNVVDLPPIRSSYICKKDGKVRIIIPASYREVKNPMKLLEAVALMADEEKKSIKIDWYGDINAGKTLFEKMKEFLALSSLADVIELHDVTLDIANRINEADFVGLFSTSEGLPNAICEGMMLSKAIVMTKVSDYNTLVDSSNGYLCEANNVMSIKNVLCSISRLSSSDLMRMGNSSKRKALSLFSSTIVLDQWKQII